MEEKLNSIIIMFIFIAGLSISMKVVSVFNIFILLAITIYLTKKCKLLKITEKKFIFSILIFGVAFLIGCLRGYIFDQNYYNSIQAEGYYDNSAIVIKCNDANVYIVKLLVKPKCLVLLRTNQELLPGMIINFKSLLEIPKDSLNRGGFSYKKYLKCKMINFIVYPEKVIIIKQVKNLDYYLFKYQKYYLKQLKQYLGERTRYIESIFLGNSKSMTKNEVNTWRNMGILHLQAVSGSQIGATLDILMFIFIITPRKGISKYIFFSIPLILYGFITDSPSVWRVILYLIIIKILEKNNKVKYEMFALMLSLFLLLMINPGMLLQISLQLSYIITTGLLLFCDYINKFKHKIYKIIVIGILSIIFSWPILIYYFQEISIFSIIFTPLFAPYIQLIIFISCIFMIIPYSIIVLRPLVYILNELLLFLDKVTILFSNIDLPMVRGKSYGIIIITLFYILIVFWNNKLFKQFYRKFIIIVLIFSIAWNNYGFNSSNLGPRVTFINVGQGDCILIECKEVDKVILIDGGVRNDYLDMGKREVMPYLKRKGIFKIDYLISTHSDNDHRGGLETILEFYEVSNILIPYNQSAEYSDWIIKYESKVRIVNEGYKIILGTTYIDVYNPIKTKADLDSNTASIVLSINYGNSNILLTADCDLEVLERLAFEDYSFDIVKAPHHGSINSFQKNIYNQLKTKCVIFSVGKNLYGHPSSEIIDNLKLNDIDFYRTDFDKDVVINLKKNEVDINDRKYID